MIKTSLKIYEVISFFVFLFFLLLCNDSFASLNVPLTVTDYAGITRTNDPITSGIPIPESENISSINQFQITDSSGNNVPAQFTVTSRWHGTPDDGSKPIKWVLLDFQANVPALGTAVYYLKNEGAGNTQDTNLAVQEDDGKITVNTGKAKFEINKNYFNLFDYVYVDKDNDGQLDDLSVSSVNEGGVVLTGKNGTKYYTTLEAPEEIEIEEQGPMRTVVKVRGVFKAEDGSYFAPSVHKSADYPDFNQPYAHSFVYYNCRIYFYNNKNYVRVFLTLENNGGSGRTNPEPYFSPIQIVYFDSVNLILKTNNTSTANVLSQDSSAQLASSDSFVLYQDWKENLTDSIKDTLEPNFENGIYYFTKKNTQQLSSGLTNPGWIDENSNSQGVGLAIRQFWQNFPKKLTVTPSEIKIGLWPEEGYYPYCQQSDFTSSTYDRYCQSAGRDGGVYLFDAGRHKTYEMLLRFYPGSQDTQTQSLSKSLEKPLMALAPSEWYAGTKALGMIGPAGLTSNDFEINEAMQRFEKLQTAMVYEEDSDNGWTISNMKTKSSFHWEFSRQNRFFNWMNFGDLLWSSASPCNLHYDWTYSMLLHYIRTNKRKLFDAGVEMAKYRYDIGQYHGDRTDKNNNHKYLNHFQFYESSGHADPTLSSYVPSRVSIPTHTWNGGITLYYLLTGDKKAWEAAEENGKGVLNYYGTGGLRDASNPRCTSDEIRYEGWSILNLINLYRVNGNPEYLNVAKNIAKNRLLYSEQQISGKGHWGAGDCRITQNHLKSFPCINVGCGNKCGNTMWSTMYIYVTEPLIDISYETGDEELKNLIIRMADFLKDQFLFGGDCDDSGNYRPLQSQYLWVAEDPDGSARGSRGEPLKTIFWADLFSYAYQLTNNSVYLDWARKSFRDGMFYYAKPGSQYLNPNTRSPITYIDDMFPNSHTKVHGWIGRTNKVYLNTEWQLQQGELSIVTTSLPDGTANQNYSYPVSIAGGTPPYTWTPSNLPSWLTVNAVNKIIREISGTPPQAGSFTFTIQVKDSVDKTVTKQFTLKVNEHEHEQTEQLMVTTQTLPEATVGVPYTAALYASGGNQPYTWFIDSNALPGGLCLNGDTISGTPTADNAYSFTVKVNDSSQEVTKELSIAVNPADATIPDIAVYEISHDFESVEIGGSADWTFVLFNKGTDSLIVNSINSGNQAFSVVLPPFPLKLSPGQTLSVTVTFTPGVEGEAFATLVINSNAPDEGKITVSVFGTGEKPDEQNSGNKTITLRNEISDTTLDGYPEARKEMNLGGVGSLYIWSNGVRKILLKSDLSQIPMDVVIEKAELKLYCYSLRWPYAPTLELYRITHDWEEGNGSWYKTINSGATWHEYDYYDHDFTETNNWSVAGGDIDTATDFGYGPDGLVAEANMQENAWITFDMSSIVQEWVSGEIENHGVLIKAINRGCNDARFYSSEYPDESLKPEFKIEYSY